MASSINKASISVSGSPDIKYYVTYTSSRSSNSSVTYNFTVKTYMVGSSSSWLGNGYKLTLYLTVNGVQKSVVLKENDESWSGGSSDGTLKSTKTLSITCTSTKGNDNQTVTFQVENKGTLDGSAGEIKTTNYYVKSPALLYTACTAPTTFTASSNNFESSVTLTWSGATAGTGNSISSYYIQYAVSSDNSNWGSWTALDTISSTATSDSCTQDMSSKVSRGYYVKFRIRTQGSAGSSYYSDYKTSSSIRRNPYTQCTAPTSFTIKSDMSDTSQFDVKVTLEWSGATNGTNNTISSYLIQYRTSSNKSTWGSWTNLQTIASTKTSGSVTVDLSTLVTRKYYVEFAIRTQGSAGSSYYSSWKYYQTSLQRNPYTKCGIPKNVKIISEADINGTTYNNIFNSSITITWSAGTAGENNAIKRYYIEYCTSSNNSTWGSWARLQSSDLTPVGSSTTTVDVSSMITRGVYMKIRIRTEGVIMTLGANNDYLYHSDFVESTSIRRNSVPNAPITLSISSHPTLEFSKGEEIKLQWDKPIDIDDNIFRYRIQYVIGSKNNVSNNTINNSWVDLATIDNKNTLEWTISAINSLFEQIENHQSDNSNSLIQFRIQAVDVFQEYNNGSNSYYTYSPIVTRYDMTGVAIGLNNKWVNCQLFVGQPTDYSNAVSTSWQAGSLNATNGEEIANSAMLKGRARTDFIENNGIAITNISNTLTGTRYNDLRCAFYYYDENYNYISYSGWMDMPSLVNTSMTSLDEFAFAYKYGNSKYIRIASYSPSYSQTDTNFVNAINICKFVFEWVEQEVSAGVNGVWTDADDSV